MIEDLKLAVLFTILILLGAYMFVVEPSRIVNCHSRGVLLKKEVEYIFFDGCYTSVDGKIIKVEELNNEAN